MLITLTRRAQYYIVFCRPWIRQNRDIGRPAHTMEEGSEITLSPYSVKQICVVKQPVGDVKKQLGQDVASISKWYLEAYQRINDVIVKNQILVASFIGYLGFSGPPTR